jgi:hypothetical protein
MERRLKNSDFETCPQAVRGRARELGGHAHRKVEPLRHVRRRAPPHALVGIAALDGTPLWLPREREGRSPYKRTLGWFAWLAKGATVVSSSVRAELEAAMGLSASSSDNDALRGLVR